MPSSARVQICCCTHRLATYWNSEKLIFRDGAFNHSWSMPNTALGRRRNHANNTTKSDVPSERSIGRYESLLSFHCGDTASVICFPYNACVQSVSRNLAVVYRGAEAVIVRSRKCITIKSESFPMEQQERQKQKIKRRWGEWIRWKWLRLRVIL